jgi:hypothetical protein
MKKEVTCVCGAVYERTEEKLTFRDSDSFECRCCDNTLESWSGSRIPVFRHPRAENEGDVIANPWRGGPRKSHRSPLTVLPCTKNGNAYPQSIKSK